VSSDTTARTPASADAPQGPASMPSCLRSATASAAALSETVTAASSPFSRYGHELLDGVPQFSPAMIEYSVSTEVSSPACNDAMTDGAFSGSTLSTVGVHPPSCR